MTVREFFAEEIEAVCGLETAALTKAFATIPRERFLGPGPWIVKGEGDIFGPPRTTPDADPRRVYHNMAIAIDPARQLFNGGPGVLATWFDALGLEPGRRVLHIGCGTGYYTAILGQIVGPTGAVEAIEVDASLASRATAALSEWPWIRVRQGDGRAHGGSFDAIVVNAGTTHPQASWLDALADGGRLIIPLTVSMSDTIGKGIVILATRDGDALPTRVVNMVAIYNAEGLRDHTLNERLGKALGRGDWMTVKHLRRDEHAESPACWLHGEGFCVSRA